MYEFNLNFFTILGLGNRKGRIWIQLMRPTSDNKKQCTGHDRKGEFQFVVSEPEMVAEDKDIFGISPRTLTKAVKILTSDDNIIQSAQIGDYFRFIKNQGGGGGHSLLVKDFRVIMQVGSKAMENYKAMARRYYTNI